MSMCHPPPTCRYQPRCRTTSKPIMVSTLFVWRLKTGQIIPCIVVARIERSSATFWQGASLAPIICRLGCVCSALISDQLSHRSKQANWIARSFHYWFLSFPTSQFTPHFALLILSWQWLDFYSWIRVQSILRHATLRQTYLLPSNEESGQRRFISIVNLFHWRNVPLLSICLRQQVRGLWGIIHAAQDGPSLGPQLLSAMEPHPTH